MKIVRKLRKVRSVYIGEVVDRKYLPDNRLMSRIIDDVIVEALSLTQRVYADEIPLPTVGFCIERGSKYKLNSSMLECANAWFRLAAVTLEKINNRKFA